MAERVEARGERSVAIGRDVINSIINTGDHNQFFVGDYERLRDAYISPWSVFERVRLDRFTGREWLMAEVDAFLRDEERGYFVLEAGAGLGKTTFLAHLAKERGYVHHFVELAPGRDGITPSLRNLAAQLVRAWELNPYLAEGVLPGAASRPDFLQNLLVEAARKRDEVRPGEPIIVVVDALDEAGVPAGQNVLGLPRVLPGGVYFIVSQRPVAVPLRVEGTRRVFRLETEGDENLADMRAYLEAAATWEGVARELQAEDDTSAIFVEILLQKCQGVWIYLHYVVREIERGERSPLDLETLPEDVWQYYAQYWGRWRARDETAWDGEYLPLLSTLAVAQEALPLPQLCALAGVTARPSLDRLLREIWRPFLAAEDAGDSPRYRLHHVSLREFLDGRTDLARLTEAERSLAEEIAGATHQAHDRIADRYLGAWGGLDAGLPGLQESEQRSLDGGYGLRHLAAHLEGAWRVDDLHNLLRAEGRRYQEEEFYARTHLGCKGMLNEMLDDLWPSRQPPVQIRIRSNNTWYTAREQVGDTSGYLSDVARAWHLVEEASAREIERGKTARVDLETRYALLTTSINSLAGNILPGLLAALVEKKVWPLSLGLIYARQVPDMARRAEALAALVPHLIEPLKGKVLTEALIAARVSEHKRRAEALAALVPHLIEPLKGAVLTEALAAARAIERKHYRAEALAGLTHHLPETERLPVLREALATMRESGYVQHRAVAELASQLAALGHLEEALVEARRSYDDYKPKVLADVAHFLPKPEREQVLREALKAVDNAWDRAFALVGVAPYLSEAKRLRAIRKVLAKRVPENLAWLIPHLPERLLPEAMKVARATIDPDRRASALAVLAPYLPEWLLREALTAARAIGDTDDRAKVLARLAPRLPEASFQDSLMAATAIEDEKYRAKVLVELAPHLPQTIMREALKAVRAIRNENARADALLGLAPHLPEVLLRKVLVLTAVWKFRKFGYPSMINPGLRVLKGLGPHLPKALLRKALVVARLTILRSERASALAALAASLPKNERLPVVRKALAIARAVRQEWSDDPTLEYRSAGLARLAPHLAAMDHVDEALALMREIQGAYAQSELLAGVAPYLAESQLSNMLTLARMINDKYGQEKVLAALAARQAALKRPEEALAMIPEITHAHHRSRVLVDSAMYLPEPLLREAVAAAQKIEDARCRVEALTSLAPHLPEDDVLQVLHQALEGVRAIKNEGWRTHVLAGLAPYLPEYLLPEALAIARTIAKGDLLEVALTGLAPHLEHLPLVTLYPLWRETLHDLASRTRPDLLLGLRALIPVIAALGGEEAVAETYRAIQDVGRWWP